MKPSKAIYTNKIEIAQLKLTGKRLYSSREMVSISQEQAATLLGTSKQAIADAEAGKLNPMPLKLLKGAAELYHCSSEWLLGLSDDWESDPELIRERDFLAGLYKTHLRHYAAIVERQNEAEEAELAHGQLTAAVAEISEALEKFTELNPEFETMLGGARLLRSINSARNANRNIKPINAPLIRENGKKPPINA